MKISVLNYFKVNVWNVSSLGFNARRVNLQSKTIQEKKGLIRSRKKLFPRFNLFHSWKEIKFGTDSI